MKDSSGNPMAKPQPKAQPKPKAKSQSQASSGPSLKGRRPKETKDSGIELPETRSYKSRSLLDRLSALEAQMQMSADEQVKQLRKELAEKDAQFKKHTYIYIYTLEEGPQLGTHNVTFLTLFL